jgi:hypothetical protein
VNRIMPMIAIAALLNLAPVVAATAQNPVWNTLPGEFAMRTLKGFYVTAINGGGRTTDPIVVTAARSAGPWEKFRLAVMDPPALHDKSIQTSGGNYLTAVDGGGRTTDVLHTDATQVRDWEQFRLDEVWDVPTYFAIQTIHRNYLTAVGEGGKFEDAIHTDAPFWQLGQWEYFRVVKCGDLGPGYQYTIVAANDQFLYAKNGGGLTEDTISESRWPGDATVARFKFIRQSDGSYALQTSNGVNYVTALGGGGKVERYNPPDCGFGACIATITQIFHTDATQVQAWERFKIIDQGDCRYAIQTVSGFFVGIFKDSSGFPLLTTDRSTISENEKFQLVMYGLGSPAVLHRR